MNWQPIDTAPKDGTEILGWGECAGEINGPHGVPCKALIEWRGGRTDWAGYEWSVNGGDHYSTWMKPTHWFPLPPPPSEVKT